jgi:hypothetical protein
MRVVWSNIHHISNPHLVDIAAELNLTSPPQRNDDVLVFMLLQRTVPAGGDLEIPYVKPLRFAAFT